MDSQKIQFPEEKCMVLSKFKINDDKTLVKVVVTNIELKHYN